MYVLAGDTLLSLIILITHFWNASESVIYIVSRLIVIPPFVVIYFIDLILFN